MALGNAWHFPDNPEPFGNAGMRDPVFPTDPVSTVTVFSGNQYQGGANSGNQLQDGSVVRFKRTTDAVAHIDDMVGRDASLKVDGLQQPWSSLQIAGSKT